MPVFYDPFKSKLKYVIYNVNVINNNYYYVIITLKFEILDRITHDPVDGRQKITQKH